MKKKHLNKIIFTVIILFIAISCCNFVHAEIDSSLIWGEAWSLSSAGSLIVGMIRWVGIAILIGAIILKGIKFVTAAPEGQASIKKELTLLIIGAIMLFALTTIIDIIYKAVVDAGLH